MRMNNNQKRTVSVPLALGIFIIPIVFAWFTLRKGYSTLARVLSFGWLLAGIVAFALLPSVPEESPVATKTISEPKDEVHYTILNEEVNGDIKRVVEIQLDERISENKVSEIANKIKAADKKKYERTFVLFFLEGVDRSGGAWATATFDPDLKIKVIGSSKISHEALQNKEIVSDGKLLGTWDADWGFEYKMVFEEKDGKLFKREVFSDSESKLEEIKKVMIDGREVYQDESGEDHGEYYIINKNGDLEFWSKNGNYYTAPKIK